MYKTSKRGKKENPLSKFAVNMDLARALRIAIRFKFGCFRILLPALTLKQKFYRKMKKQLLIHLSWHCDWASIFFLYGTAKKLNLREVNERGIFEGCR